MKKISFLKFNDVDMSFRLSQYVSFNEILKQLFQFQLKYSSAQIRTILDKYFEKQIFNELKSIKITRECNKEIEFVVMTHHNQNVLFFDFHELRLFDVIEEQNNDFLVYVFELVLIAQSIHEL